MMASGGRMAAAPPKMAASPSAADSPGIATPERGDEAVLPAKQQNDHHTAASPPPGRQCRSLRMCLDELLEATAALVAELDQEELTMEVGAPGLQDVEAAARGKLPPRRAYKRPPYWRSREKRSPPSWTSCQVGLPAKTPMDIPSPKCQLPFVKEFTAVGGD
ncbi:unnamed protein product [Lampetra fluviatilis]